MNQPIQSRIIHIRSSDCIYKNGYNDNITLVLKEPIICENDEDFIIQILNASIPYSFYNINYSNKYLDVQETFNNVSTNFTIVIDEGNYNITQLISYLQTQLNLHSPNHFSYTLSYNKINNKVSITLNSQNSTSKFLFETGSNNKYSCEFLLGFPSVDYTLTYNTAIISPNVVNMSPYDAIYIRSNLGIVNQYESLTKSLSDVLVKIGINSNPFSYINYDDISNNKKFHSTLHTINDINLYLTDMDSFPIDLNGIGWFISVKIERIKKQNHYVLNRNELIDILPSEEKAQEEEEKIPIEIKE